MKKWLAMLLALIMVLSMTVLAGCDEDKKDDEDAKESTSDKADEEDKDNKEEDKSDKTEEAPIVGRWKTLAWNFGDDLATILSEVPMMDYVELDSYPVYMYYEFEADGQWSAGTIDEELDAIVQGVLDDMTDGFEAWLEAEDVDLETVLAETGCDSAEEVVQSLLADEESEIESTESYLHREIDVVAAKGEGTYSIEGDSLIIGFDGDEETMTWSFEITGDDLLFSFEGETMELTKA